MRNLGQLVRVVSVPDEFGIWPSRYSGTTGRITHVLQERPTLYRIKTIAAKEYGRKISGGFGLLVFSDEIRTVVPRKVTGKREETN